MTHSYNTRYQNSKKLQCVFNCCVNRTLKDVRTGNRLSRLKCAECCGSYHDMCLFELYGVFLADAYELNKLKEWLCPNCFDEEPKTEEPPPKRRKVNDDDDISMNIDDICDNDSDIDYIIKTSKRRKSGKKSRKSRRNKYDSSASAESDSSSEPSELSKKRDKKTKKIILKLKSRKKAILNRLRSVDIKHGLKYNKKMLQVSDSGTDLDFDAANFYPDKAPKDTKKLESLRAKKAKKKKAEYVVTKKSDSRYRRFEKDAIIEVIEDIGNNPEKYKYTQRYGWCKTDIAMIVRDRLYNLRKKSPEKYTDIPYRNAASIGSKFSAWDLTENKEGFDKNYIAKYETAKFAIDKKAKKGTTSVNGALNQFGTERTAEKLKKAQIKIKTLTTDNNIKQTLNKTINMVNVLVKDIKNEKNVENEAKNGNTNSYIDNTLLQSVHESHANNEAFIAKHSVGFGANANTQQQIANNNALEKKTDECIRFVTKLSNSKKSPFDEVNDKLKSDVRACELILFDAVKCKKLARKYAALVDPILDLSDAIILNQLALTANILL